MSYVRPVRVDELVKWLKDNFGIVTDSDLDIVVCSGVLAEALVSRFDIIMESSTPS